MCDKLEKATDIALYEVLRGIVDKKTAREAIHARKNKKYDLEEIEKIMERKFECILKDLCLPIRPKKKQCVQQNHGLIILSSSSKKYPQTHEVKQKTLLNGETFTYASPKLKEDKCENQLYVELEDNVFYNEETLKAQFKQVFERTADYVRETVLEGSDLDKMEKIRVAFRVLELLPCKFYRMSFVDTELYGDELFLKWKMIKAGGNFIKEVPTKKNIYSKDYSYLKNRENLITLSNKRTRNEMKKYDVSAYYGKGGVASSLVSNDNLSFISKNPDLQTTKFLSVKRRNGIEDADHKSKKSKEDTTVRKYFEVFKGKTNDINKKKIEILEDTEQVKSLKEQINKLHGKLINKTTKIEAATKKWEERENLLKAAEKYSNEKEAEVAALNKKMDTMQTELNSLLKDLDQKQKELSDMKIENNKILYLTTQLESLNFIKENTENELKATKSELDQLKERHPHEDSYINQIFDLDNKVRKLENDLTTTEKNFRIVNEECNLLRKDMDTSARHFHEQKAKLEQEITFHVNKFENLKNEFDRKSKSHDDLQKEYNKAKSNIFNLQKKVVQYDKRYDKLKVLYEKLLKRNKSKAQRLNAQNQEIQDLKDKLKKCIEECKANNEEQSIVLLNYTHTVNLLQSNNEFLKKAITSMNTQYKDQRQLAEYQREYERTLATIRANALLEEKDRENEEKIKELLRKCHDALTFMQDQLISYYTIEATQPQIEYPPSPLMIEDVTMNSPPTSNQSNVPDIEIVSEVSPRLPLTIGNPFLLTQGNSFENTTAIPISQAFPRRSERLKEKNFKITPEVAKTFSSVPFSNENDDSRRISPFTNKRFGTGISIFDFEEPSRKIQKFTVERSNPNEIAQNYPSQEIVSIRATTGNSLSDTARQMEIVDIEN